MEQKYIIELTLKSEEDRQKVRSLVETAHGQELMEDEDFEEMGVEGAIKDLFSIEDLDKNITIKKV